MHEEITSINDTTTTMSGDTTSRRPQQSDDGHDNSVVTTIDTMMISDPELEPTEAPKRRPSLTLHKIPDDENKRLVRKNVTFVLVDDGDRGGPDSPTDNTTTPSFELTNELCHDLWYQTPEIAAMKLDAKRVLLNRKDASPEEMIGLERFNVHRSVWKKSAIHYVLLAQKKRQGDEDFIQRVSQRCSGWARETAVHQGFKDYCAIHDPLASLFGSEEENYNDCFFSDPSRDSEDGGHHSNKRKLSEHDELHDTPNSTPDSRNVRSRTAMTVENDDEGREGRTEIEVA